MSCPDSVLREARSAVKPFVPEFAPYLTKEPNIFRVAIFSAIEEWDVDPHTIPEADINKTIRHTIMSFAIGQQKQYLIEGEKEAATFIPAMTQKYTKKPDTNPYYYLELAAQDIHNRGARQIERRYSNPLSLNRHWWPSISKYYIHLAEQALSMPEYQEQTVPLEGRSLHEGLRNHTGFEVGFLMRFVKDKQLPKGDFNERLQACHQLAPLVIARGGRHFWEHALSKTMYDAFAPFPQDPQTGRFAARRSAQENWNEVFPHFTDLHTATLKCAAHAELGSFVHATINLGAAMELQRTPELRELL